MPGRGVLYDVVVIGAGPCGSYIARSLSRLGHSVVVVEKNVRPDDNVCCTGIVSQECLSDFDLDESLVLRQVSSASFRSSSGRCLRLYREAPVAAVIDRPRLNMSLAQQAEAAGAHYLFGAMATDIMPNSDAVEVRVNGQRQGRVLKAEAAIIATGFGSRLPASLGLGEIRQFTLGAQAEVAINGVDEVEIYLDHKLAPGAFAWLVPTKDGKGLAGLLTRHQAGFRLKDLLYSLSRQGKIASRRAPLSYGLIPLKPLTKTCTNRVLVVGEAAGQVKPTSGGGIYYGLLCADIASEVLHQAFGAGDFSAAALAAYQKRWRASLNRELKVGYWARSLFASLSDRHIDWLFRIADKRGIAELVATTQTLAFDWHSRLLFQMARQLLPFPKALEPAWGLGLR